MSILNFFSGLAALLLVVVGVSLIAGPLLPIDYGHAFTAVNYVGCFTLGVFALGLAVALWIWAHGRRAG